jgi:hypothetical protein
MNIAKKFQRGPIEKTAGMIRVSVEVQRENEGQWYARVYPNGLLHEGSTREEAIQLALKASSVPRNTLGLIRSSDGKLNRLGAIHGAKRS